MNEGIRGNRNVVAAEGVGQHLRPCFRRLSSIRELLKDAINILQLLCSVLVCRSCQNQWLDRKRRIRSDLDTQPRPESHLVFFGDTNTWCIRAGRNSSGLLKQLWAGDVEAARQRDDVALLVAGNGFLSGLTRRLVHHALRRFHVAALDRREVVGIHAGDGRLLKRSCRLLRC